MNDGKVLEMGILDKENVMLLARIAEQSEQYDDMIDILKPYFEMKAVDEDLSSEERNLLQVAYKNAVGLRRIAWRAAKKAGSTAKFGPFHEHIGEYLTRLETECVDICKDLLNLITKHLMPRAKRT
jgi:14-3-3 protein epsilon